MVSNRDLAEATDELEEEAFLLIKDMEEHVENLYTNSGLYDVFKRGYFPVPYLWEGREEFAHAVDWTTKIMDGGVYVVDKRGRKMSIQDRLARIKKINSES